MDAKKVGRVISFRFSVQVILRDHVNWRKKCRETDISVIPKLRKSAPLHIFSPIDVNPKGRHTFFSGRTTLGSDTRARPLTSVVHIYFLLSVFSSFIFSLITWSSHSFTHSFSQQVQIIKLYEFFRVGICWLQFTKIFKIK